MHLCSLAALSEQKSEGGGGGRGGPVDENTKQLPSG